MSDFPAHPWPEAVSDGLTLPCADCGEVPRFDYRVTEEFWRQWVPGPDRLGVVCLPCLDRRSGGRHLAQSLLEVQWTGTGHTVVMTPTFRHDYGDHDNLACPQCRTSMELMGAPYDEYSKVRPRARQRGFSPMVDGIDYDSSEQ